MNRRTKIIIVVGLVVLTLIVTLSIFSTTRTSKEVEEVTYTDAVSNELISTAPTRGNSPEHEHAQETPIGEIAIVGINEFLNSLPELQSASIHTQLLQFIRAQAGTGIVKASVVDAEFKQSPDTDSTYTFTLVTLRPEARYTVTVNLPDSLVDPEMTFVKEAS